MKASRYNLSIVNPGTQETILYNTLYGSLTVWEAQETQIVKRILDDPSVIAETELAIVNMLVEQQHLVEDVTDEFEIIAQRKRMGIKDTNRLDVVIMPTLDCNFACTYCYEVAHQSRMSVETEEAIKKWFHQQIPRHKFLMLHWYGGEPMLGYRSVLSLSQYVSDIATQVGTAYVIHITTNGYLLTRQRIEELLSVGIKDFQITVDGPPEAHNNLRILKNGQGTFDRVFQNIIDLAHADAEVKITLRINFNHSNLYTIPRLLELFPEDVRSQLRVIYEPIFGQCDLSATDNMDSKEISQAMTDYYTRAHELGYDVILSAGGIHTGKLVYCYAERDHQVIINYNADVYKCSVSTFTPEERLGYIDSNGTLQKVGELWDTWVSENDLFAEVCTSCVYLPLCMGGCRKMRLQHNDTGSYCSLVPTNASYTLKQIALAGFGDLLLQESDM
jgi:uncharacterized protein